MAAAPTLLKLLKKAKQAELSPKIWLLISEQGQQDLLLLLLQHSVQHLSCSAGIDLGARTMSRAHFRAYLLPSLGLQRLGLNELPEATRQQ